MIKETGVLLFHQQMMLKKVLSNYTSHILGIFFSYVFNEEIFTIRPSKNILLHHLGTFLQGQGMRLEIFTLHMWNAIFHVPHILLYGNTSDTACCLTRKVQLVVLDILDEVLMILIRLLPHLLPPHHPLHYLLYQIWQAQYDNI